MEIQALIRLVQFRWWIGDFYEEMETLIQGRFVIVQQSRFPMKTLKGAMQVGSR